MKVVIASNNKGKIREFSKLLDGFDIVSQGELGVKSCEEPYSTFLENALKKARHASLETGLPAIADDSGIVVPALNGAPGVYSARFSKNPEGIDQDEANNLLLIEKLKNISDRTAYYVCYIVWLSSHDDPSPLVAHARWYGEIINKPRGDGGFGYDPYFYIASLGKTAAELDLEYKNKLSHRGLAMQTLLKLLNESIIT
ncbi:RdgB/HAM1 family non-canonical purine NTP pyrophosphatase [Taylorella equigenitalis]|uniref:RdgB/HAM1 family non-canonical purine NTP pyrophosphatase n=1 Tax=Taylorella equigenitalis TaxID=29575 RepID=UPI00237D0B04|nr:RdgB/HAM1 family non-canonical purine NTP pyrophosphatase [Taylorella equigenitalis]WDU54399.1 RdgB/HAM1 family non-canonical purine NTP pyrophosphatase [Taylorella equigenitalis]